MRMAHLAWAGVIALALATDAHAQNFQSAISGIKPSDVQFKKVDTSSAIGGAPSLTEAGQFSFGLTGLFRKITNFNRPTPTATRVPTPQYNSRFTPLKPINATIVR